MNDTAPKKGFSAWTVATFGVGPAAAFIILSERGEGVMNTLQRVPALLSAWTEASPIGAWTLLAALVVPALFMLKLDAWLGIWDNKHTKATLIDLAGFCGAIWIAYLLVPSLPGFLIGFFCASLTSTLAKWLRAIGLLIERKRRALAAEETAD